LIAELVGKGSEVKNITTLAMREGLNFESALERRLAIIKGTGIEVLEKCMAKRINIRRGADVLFKTFKKHLGETAILSGGFTFFADRVQKKLKADFSFANVLEFKKNRLTGKTLGSTINSEKKTELMKQLSARQGKNTSNVVAVGDGNNDMGMISEARVGISFKGSRQLNLTAKHVLKNSDISAILYLLGLREDQFVY
jgi:phosphoserine phosphatase